MLIIFTLVLSFFTASAVVQPSTTYASEVSITSAPAQDYFKIHIPYTSVERIWHTGQWHGATYSGYVYYLRQYLTDSGMRVVYGGMLRRGPL